MRFVSRFLLAFMLFSLQAWAQSPNPRLRNAELREQVQAQSSRTLHCEETQCFAIDGHLFYRTPPKDGFLYYHGGYWVDAFLEFSPSRNFSFNTRLAVFHPAASYGVVSSAEILPFVAVTWEENLSRYSLGDINAKLRWLDLDRQTLGAGLTLENKDMAGLILEFSGEVSRLRFVLDGTGGYMVERDLWYAQFDLWEERLGVYAFSLDTTGEPHAFGIFSKLPLLPGLSLDSELASRRSAWAALSRVNWDASWKRLSFKSSVQVRYYGAGFAGDIAGQIHHDYIPLEYEDRSFMISENIFSFDDDVLATGGRIELKLALSPLWNLGVDLESTHFNFAKIEDQKRLFYKTHLSLCPSEQGCGSLFVSNRALTAVSDPIKNRPLLSSSKFYGVDARFSF